MSKNFSLVHGSTDYVNTNEVPNHFTLFFFFAAKGAIYYVTIMIQWNHALRTPALYGQFRLSRQKAHIFSLKLTRFIRTPVNTDNGHFSVSRVTNSHILSTPLYGHWLSAHCFFHCHNYVITVDSVPCSNNDRFLRVNKILLQY